MKQGGFYERVMDAGPELDRVKSFLRRMAGLERYELVHPLQNPTFLPLFPGLEHRPFHERHGDEVANYLERAVPVIKEEAARIRSNTIAEKTGAVVTEGLWEIYPLWYMGVDIRFLTRRIPTLKKLADELPRSAFLHPFGEALLSLQQPGTHLRRHCSVDALRKRYSLGVTVEDACELRVGEIKRQWVEGEALIFEDCFEHEAWNGRKERLVFIIDTWHPDLTPMEIEVLQAGLRKKEVRAILAHFRLAEELRNYLWAQFAQEDGDSSFDNYWDREARIAEPAISDWGTWSTTTRFKK